MVSVLIPPMRPAQVARFWSYVRKSAGCWEWIGDTSDRGYGRVRLFGKNRAAHRVSWQIAFGALPDGLSVCHHCDNPPCVRPDHLYLGSHSQNMIDASRRSRLPVAKLNAEMVRAIRADIAAGESRRVIARKYGVSRRAIQFVDTGETWAHVA